MGIPAVKNDASAFSSELLTDLGSVYTGAFRFRNLARAGRARGTNEALARADALFAWDPPPFNGELF